MGIAPWLAAEVEMLEPFEAGGGMIAVDDPFMTRGTRVVADVTVSRWWWSWVMVVKARNGIMFFLFEFFQVLRLICGAAK